MENIGILDPEGKNKNPLTGEAYSEDYKKLAKIWSEFPAYDNAKGIIDDIKENQVLLIVAETGSGKTVLVPKYTLHSYKYEARIAITLPKKIIAESAAEFSAKTLDVELGGYVGYQYRGSERSARSKDTKLLYATDGTIVARLLNDPELKDFNAVIVDEAHERKVQIDFLLYLLRETLRLRPQFKVIIMSATINAKIFEDYFSGFKFKKLEIAGKTNYPIQSIFTDKDLEYRKVIDLGFNKILEILEKPFDTDSATDIIFFITSINEAFTICQRFEDHIKKTEGKNSDKTCKLTCKGDVYCVEVYSGMDPDKQRLAQDRDLYKKKNNYVRKLVIATSVAESSLTIDGIKYVVDSGYELKSFYDPENRAKRLDRKMITQAQVKQRKGRSGRTGPGVCYHLYTKNEYQKMEQYPQPDIRTNDIAPESLRLLNLQEIQNVNKLLEIYTKFIEPPRENYIRSAVSELLEIGAVKDGEITKLGTILADLGNEPKTSLALILSKAYNCSHEMIKILSCVSASKNNITNIFKLPKLLLETEEVELFDVGHLKDNKKLKYLTNKFDKARSKFKHKYGDHISILNIFERFLKTYEKNKDFPQKVENWCYENFLKFKTLNNARKLVRKNRNSLKKALRGELNWEEIGLRPKQEILKLNILDRIMACLLIAFKSNRGYKKSENYYRTKHSEDLNARVSKESFLTLDKTLPKNIIYHELFISMGNPTLNIVSKVPKDIKKLINNS